MNDSSRVKKTLLNIKVNFLCFFVNLIITFFTRSYFLKIYGTEFVGFTATIQSILGFLNIAEMGVGAAVAYYLYSPLFYDSRNEIQEIVSVFGYLYRLIGLFILVSGLIVSLFLPHIFNDIPFVLFIVYLGFYSYLYNSMLGYFVNYKQTLLSADQRNYEVTGLYQIITASKGVFQILAALYFKSVIVFFVVEILFTSIYSLILNIRIKKIYPWLKTSISDGYQLRKKYPQLGMKIRQIFVHKIGGFFQNQSLPVIIYAFVSLPMVTLYTNYSTIAISVRSMVSSLLGSTSASVGNLIAEGNKEKTLSIYKQLLSLTAIISGIISFSFYELANEFIANWVGTKYILSNGIVALISMQLFLNIFRLTTEQFVNAFGLFADVWAPIVESSLLILLSCILGYLYGLEGILLGPLVSSLFIIHIWKPYYLFSRGFKSSCSTYFVLLIRYALILIGVKFISTFLTNYLFALCNVTKNISWFSWIIHSVIFVFFMFCFCIILSILLSVDFRLFFKKYIVTRIRKKAI